MKSFRNRGLVASSVLSIITLCIAFFFNYYMSVYATERASGAVADIILSNIPVFDVDGIFLYGPVLFWLGITILVLRYPNKIPFTVNCISLFVIIRAGFVTLTHIGPFPTAGTIDWLGLVRFIDSGADLFFSGHTGLPFLMALVFWDMPVVRRICLYSSVFFGLIVLMGHFHYSIDVASAFFITYTIYTITLRIFKRDLAFFRGELSTQNKIHS
jgi:hypothetical protein